MNPFLLWLLWAMPALVAWARIFLRPRGRRASGSRPNASAPATSAVVHWQAGGCEDPSCPWSRAIEERPALAVAVLVMGAFLLGPLVFLPVGRKGPRGD